MNINRIVSYYLGMKWTSTEDEKLNKQREMEENRRLTKASIRSTSTLNVKVIIETISSIYYLYDLSFLGISTKFTKFSRF